MMQGIREFLNKPIGKIVTVVMILCSLGAVAWSVKSNLGETDAAHLARDKTFICSETLKPFEHQLSIGDKFPIESPYSGKSTGYPATACFWTADGKAKKDPTWVLLNETLGKPGPTFCPECGRLVIPHNPVPNPGDKAPPLQSEYRKPAVEQ